MIDLSDVDPLTCLEVTQEAHKSIRNFFGLHDDRPINEFTSMSGYGSNSWAIIDNELHFEILNGVFDMSMPLANGPHVGWPKCVFEEGEYVLVVTMGPYGDKVVGVIGKKDDEVPNDEA